MADHQKSLPVGWRWVRVGDVCEEQTGTRDPRSDPDASFCYIDITSVDNVSKRIVGPMSLLGRDAPSRARQIIRTDDVLIATTRPNLNAVALVPPELDNEVCSTGFCVLRPKPELFSHYLFGFVRTSEFVERLSGAVKGAMYPAVTDSQVRAEIIPLPPLDEQKRIAAILNEQMAAVERARAAAGARLEAAKALRSAYLRHAFRGVTPLSVGAAREAAPAGWRWVLLTKIARLESGHTPSRYHPEWWGGSIPWIALPDIRNLDGKVAYETSERTNEAGIANSSARILPAATVCLSRTASVGFVTVMGREMATSQDFVNWVCGPDLNPYFLAFLLQAARDYIRSLSSGAIHQTVYVPTVKRFEICFPSGTEQESIVRSLSDQLTATEQARKATQEELGVINKLPAALLRRAFNGEL